MRVQFYQVGPRAVKFFSDYINSNYGPAEFSHARSGQCDIQINGVRMSEKAVLVEKIKNQFKKVQNDLAPEIKYQNSEIRPNKNAKRNIWHTGENLRPPLHLQYDYYLSFDRDDFDGRNIYFPLWYLDINWGFNEKFCPRIGTILKGKELTGLRKTPTSKSKFACAFIGNNHPVRLAAIKKLAEIENIDVYGKAVGRPVLSKFNIAKDYKYTICFENDLYPGYVTEKLLDAYYCDSVPIYWGDLGAQDHINSGSYLNLKDFQNLDLLRQKISSIQESEYNQIYNQPFLNSMPSLDALDAIFRGIL
jgi:hypothetical protein